MAAPKWQPARDFGDRHISLMALPTINRASPMDLVYRSLDAASDAATNGKTVRGRQRVEVFMANDFEAVADHAVEGFAAVQEFDREPHRFALHAAPDRLLHR